MSTSPEQDRAAAALAALMELVARLRAPDGCPWDRKQTNASAARYLLEEAFEAVEAIENGTPPQACGELGDVLFQVVFQAQLYAEAGHFDLARVMEEVHAKMTRRHPHVFGGRKVDRAEEVLALWGEIKEKERRQNGEGLLESVPAAAPALVRAQRLGQKAAQVGLDWDSAPQVWDKALEEMRELQEATDQEQLLDELVDLLFTWAQWARHRGLDAEAALRRANARFVRRFAALERLAAGQGRELKEMGPQELDRLWEQVKAAERGGDTPDC